MINQEAFKKSAKKTHEVADFTHALTKRALLMAAKRLIDYGYNYASFKGWYGEKFKFPNSKRLAVALKVLEEAMEKIVVDSAVDVSENSKEVAKKHLGRIPDKDWEVPAFIATVFFGKTYNRRVKDYTEVFRNEIESMLRVGQDRKMTADGVYKWYADIMEEPRSDSMLIEGIASGLISDIKGLSAYRSFRNLNDDMVVRAFSNANSHYWQFADAKFIIAQKDEKTCDVCIDLDGKIYPIKEDILPAHGSCRCIEIPIMNTPY